MVIFPKIQKNAPIVTGSFLKIHFDAGDVKNAKEWLRKQQKWCKVKWYLQENFRLPMIEKTITKNRGEK